jgi:hypothetical protein
MKNLKGVVIAVAAVLAVLPAVGARTAPAAVLCKTTTTPCSSAYLKGSGFDAALATTATLETTGGTTLATCTAGTLKGTLSARGAEAEAEAATVALGSFTLSGCSNTTSVLKAGELSFPAIAGTDNGTVVARNTEVTFNGIFGASCVYGTGSGIELGTLVGGGSPTLKLNAFLSLVSGNGLCPSQARWTAEYNVAEPKPVYVEPE